MKRHRVAAGVGIAAVTGLVLTGCSMDTLIWGEEAARVIAVTDQLVAEVVAGESGPRVCVDAEPDIGDPQRWKGLSAGEPERLAGEFWQEQQALGATWTINLEGLDVTTAENGGEYPSFVFYSEADGGLCVVDIEWGTVTF